MTLHGLRRADPLVLSTVGVLAAANLLDHFAPGPLGGPLVVPIAALVVLVLGRRFGLSWAALGLDRAHARSGAKYAALAVGVVVIGVALAAALPLTRDAFLDDRYRNSAVDALVLAFVLVPLRTVVPEEIAFRGVLLAAITRRHGVKAGVIGSSVLFGLWHVTSSLSLASGNEGVSSAFGNGLAAEVVSVGGVVLATTAAGLVFCWLRLRSGSLIAPIGLHWATNGIAALTSAIVWGLTT